MSNVLMSEYNILYLQCLKLRTLIFAVQIKPSCAFNIFCGLLSSYWIVVLDVLKPNSLIESFFFLLLSE